MDVRERVERLAEALQHPDGIDLDDWFSPDARLELVGVGLERDLRAVLGPGGPGAGVLPLAACSVDIVRAVRNVVMANWDAALRGVGGADGGAGGGRSGNAVLSLDRHGYVTHVRLEGALLAG